MKDRFSGRGRILLQAGRAAVATAAIFAAAVSMPKAYAQGGVGAKPLFDPALPGADRQLLVTGGKESQAVAVVGGNGIEVTVKAGPQGYPGVALKPAGGAVWDLSLYGHAEAKITNTGAKKISLSLRVDNEGDSKSQSWNCEGKILEPGQTKTIRVYFGYSYGFKPGFKLNPEKVSQILFFTGKTDADLSFRIENILGAGWVGEKIGVDPDRVAKKPVQGILFDASHPVKIEKQVVTAGGAKAAPGPDGKALQLSFAGGNAESVTVIPAEGLWNLNEQLEVKVKVRNAGAAPVTPAARLESDSGPSDLITAAAPLAPGAETDLVIPFAARVPWKGQVDPEQENPKKKGSWTNQPGTGTLYRSNLTSGVTVLTDTTAGAKSLQVISIVASLPPLTLPAWLGKRPPVDGDWALTLDENFDGDTIDLKRWSVHAANWWDKRNHFSKDQVIVKDGFLTIRTEKKTGFHNDDPTGKIKYSGAKSEYATGWANSYGKWTQRYGYFEIREKQPTAKCMWPGLWMMPDRGKDAKITYKRGETAYGGMEFDITEAQSAWGIHRFNIAMHWDSYKEAHKSLGTSANYVQADKDGFIIVGLLWTPGSLVFYGNGKEFARWESPRVSAFQAELILQNLIGGWDNEELDDAQLPADFVIDYIRVWQRKDLATPEDGAKPNKGGLDAFAE